MSDNFNPALLDAAALAYLGDSVIEIYVRQRLVRSGIARVGALNEASHAYVTAKAQCEAFRRIEAMLTDEENDIFHRGRNSSHINGVPKSATMSEYRIATGMEALFGYLYLCAKSERMQELLNAAYPE